VAPPSPVRLAPSEAATLVVAGCHHHGCRAMAWMRGRAPLDHLRAVDEGPRMCGLQGTQQVHPSPLTRLRGRAGTRARATNTHRT